MTTTNRVARLRRVIVQLDQAHMRADTLTLWLQRCPCKSCYRCDLCDDARAELEALTERRLALLESAGVRDRCTEGEADGAR